MTATYRTTIFMMDTTPASPAAGSGATPLTATNHVRIERNHIHDIGKTLLSDMGGIYTLGHQEGTVIRGNRIHNIEMDSYGGWGVYLDEGSSDILVEDNIAYDLTAQPFHQHYGAKQPCAAQHLRVRRGRRVYNHA